MAVGAHYDHLGRGGAGNSLADKEDANQIHHGADDNASGTATVLNIADALAKQPRKRNLLIAFWSGEELGLLGSNAFVTKPPVPLDQVAAYLNFDMVGRVADNKLTVQATGTSAMWPKLLEQANVAAGFDLIAAGRSVSADRRRQLQHRERRVPDVLHRRAPGVPQAQRHRRQDQLRGSRSRRRVRDGDRQAVDGCERCAAVHEGRAEDRHRRPRRPAPLHRHDSRLRVGREGPAARRRDRRRPRGTGRARRRAT